jgi:hypothetical protein
LDGADIRRTFYALSRQVGLRGPSDSHGPRLHDTSPPKSETPALLDTYARSGCPMAPSTARTPSLSRGSLRRQSSTIRTGCANERPSGSARGVPREWYLYRDLKTPVQDHAAWSTLVGRL